MARKNVSTHAVRYKNGQVPLMFWIPRPVSEALKAKAIQEDRSQSSLVRRILATALKVDTAA